MTDTPVPSSGARTPDGHVPAVRADALRRPVPAVLIRAATGPVG